MQRVVFDEPYRFIPPYRGRFWSTWLRFFVRRYLRRTHAIAADEVRGIERLQASIAAGHGVILALNHCRPSDPIVSALIAMAARTHKYVMASWHVFKQNRRRAFFARRLGAFSIYREGLDRQALDCAIDILTRAERPLTIFPEGVISRANARLAPLMEGVSFIARTAARRRAKVDSAAKVVVHPVALWYRFRGDLAATVEPVLSAIEARLTWPAQRHLPLFERIGKLGEALLALKEVEHLGAADKGNVYDRLERLIEHLLRPVEEEWLNGAKDGPAVVRVKNLRQAIVPTLVKERHPDEERSRRWRQLRDLYLAQQLSLYPRGYLAPDSPAERYLETVERFEEDTTDFARPLGPLHAILDIGEPLVISPNRVPKNGPDPLLAELSSRLQDMLVRLEAEGI